LVRITNAQFYNLCILSVTWRLHVLVLWPSSGSLHEDFVETYSSTSFTKNINLFVVISAVLVKIIVFVTI